MKKITSSFLLIVCSAMLFGTNPIPKQIWKDVVPINTDWLYFENDIQTIPTVSDEAYQKIVLPHTWNALDVLQTKDYRRAGSWYRKHLSFSAKDLEKRQYVRFLAAGQQAKVYFNGELLTYHVGGYSAFTCELSKKIKIGDNQLDVWVSNADDKTVAPISGDFNFYGGLYRGVELITAPKTSLSRNYLGGSGVHVWSEKVSDTKSDVNVSAQIDNGTTKNQKLELLAILTDHSGKVVSSGSVKVILKAGQIQKLEIPMPEVVNPMLWSPETPNLYSLKIELKQKNKIIDEISLQHGFRWYEFTADKGFFLNGKSYKLHGINRHQDFYKEGNAVSLQRHLDDIKSIKEMGLNWLRLAHYQQDDYVLQLCDELGILVWEEIPWVNNTSKEKAFELNLHAMMYDLINQHFNHPSIILWGIGNEVWMSNRGDGYADIYDIAKGLNKIVHTEDPVRKSVFVSGDNDKPIDFKVFEVTDVFGYNLYRGWYGTHYDTFTSRVNELHAKMPGKPLIISEFGAGNDTKVHSEMPSRQDFSVEYQNDFMLSHLAQLEKMDWLCGFNWWSFADFGAAHRGDTKPHVNQKGIFTFDRQKKDVFYILKSKFGHEPVLYLETPFWTERNGDAAKNYRVFTNMDEVELFQNGKSLGKQKSGFVWKLNLLEGENTLLAKGIKGDVKKEHGFKVNFQKGLKTYTVVASSELELHSARFAVDNNPDTFWSGQGECSIQLDMDRICLLNGVTIQYFKDKSASFNIEIFVSVDGVKWEKQFEGVSNKNSDNETFMFPKQQEVRYLKIISTGSNTDKKTNLREIIPIITLEKAEMNLYEKVGAGK